YVSLLLVRCCPNVKERRGYLLVSLLDGPPGVVCWTRSIERDHHIPHAVRVRFKKTTRIGVHLQTLVDERRRAQAGVALVARCDELLGGRFSTQEGVMCLALADRGLVRQRA